VDINLAIAQPWRQPLLPYVPGLGPRKAAQLLRNLSGGTPLWSRLELKAPAPGVPANRRTQVGGRRAQQGRQDRLMLLLGSSTMVASCIPHCVQPWDSFRTVYPCCCPSAAAYPAVQAAITPGAGCSA
jgi:hypothetical protein